MLASHLDAVVMDTSDIEEVDSMEFLQEWNRLAGERAETTP